MLCGNEPVESARKEIEGDFVPSVYPGHGLEGSHLAFGARWETSRERFVVCDVLQTIKNNPHVDEGRGGFSILLVTSRLATVTPVNINFQRTLTSSQI